MIELDAVLREAELREQHRAQFQALGVGDHQIVLACVQHIKRMISAAMEMALCTRCSSNQVCAMERNFQIKGKSPIFLFFFTTTKCVIENQ